MNKINNPPAAAAPPWGQLGRRCLRHWVKSQEIKIKSISIVAREKIEINSAFMLFKNST